MEFTANNGNRQIGTTYSINKEHDNSSSFNVKKESEIKQKIYDSLWKMASFPSDEEELNEAEYSVKKIQSLLEDLVNEVYLTGYKAGVEDFLEKGVDWIPYDICDGDEALKDMKEEAEFLLSSLKEERIDMDEKANNLNDKDASLDNNSFSSMPICEIVDIYPTDKTLEPGKITIDVMFPSEASIDKFVNCVGEGVLEGTCLEKIKSEIRDYIFTYKNAPSYLMSFNPSEGPSYTFEIELESILPLMDQTNPNHGIVEFYDEEVKTLFLSQTNKLVPLTENDLQRISNAMDMYAEISNANCTYEQMGFALDKNNVMAAYKWKDLHSGDKFVLYGTVYPQLSILNERGEDCVRDFTEEYGFTEEDVSKIYDEDLQSDYDR